MLPKEDHFYGTVNQHSGILYSRRGRAVGMLVVALALALAMVAVVQLQ